MNTHKHIEELYTQIEKLQCELQQAKCEIDERKKLNEAQIQYRKDSQVSLLQDISRALKPQYGDFVESLDTPMNAMLGEIYREKIKQVFKILEQKGIKIEE